MGKGPPSPGSTDPHSVPPPHGSVWFFLTHQAGSKAVIWPGFHSILPFLWLYLMSQGWGKPGLGDRASSNVVFALWFSVSYENCRTPLPSKAFLPQGNPSETILDGVKSPLHCQEPCQVTRWHWRIRPPNISQRAHLLLPFNSLFGCWHGEDFVFPELDVCQHRPCSPIHPHPPPALSKLLTPQM